MRQLICRRTCEWLEIGYTYRAVCISYLVRLAEVAHIHIGYCKITTCYRARPDKRAQRCNVSSFIQLSNLKIVFFFLIFFICKSPVSAHIPALNRRCRERGSGGARTWPFKKGGQFKFSYSLMKELLPPESLEISFLLNIIVTTVL